MWYNISMGVLGEIKTGLELGKPNGRRYHKYIHHACIDCGIKRWTTFDSNIIQSLRCKTCENRQKAKVNPHLFKQGKYQGYGFKKGIHSSPEYEFKKGHPPLYPIGIKRPEISGENHPNWKGGITPYSESVRKSALYSLWRKSVFERDKHTCQKCGQRSGRLNAHHDLTVKKAPLFMLDISNGITLCVPCHKLAHKAMKGGDAKRKQIRK